MTIETSPPSSPAKAGSVADSRNGKPGGKAPAAGALGFMAVLSAVDAPVATAAASGDEKSEKKSTLAQTDSASLAINLIAQALLPTVDLSSAATSAGLTTGDSDAGDSLDLSALLLDSDFLPGIGETSLNTDKDSLTSLISASDPGADTGLAGTGAPAPVGPLVAVTKPAPTNLSDVPGRPLAPLEFEKPGKAAKGLPQAVVDSKARPAVTEPLRESDTKFFAALEAMKSVQFGKEVSPIQVPAVVSMFASEKALAEKTLGGPVTSEPTYTSFGATTLGTTSYASTAAPEVGATGTEMQVAEQVTYWISQDIQNAELKLDGLGQESVDVSISMSGNEAHVVFRTDEVETREVLENASEHLKELLRGEGLVLGGVSVGTSGSGNPNGEDRKARQAAAQTAAISAPQGTAGEVQTRRPMAGPAGRTLDLFV